MAEQSDETKNETKSEAQAERPARSMIASDRPALVGYVLSALAILGLLVYLLMAGPQ